MIILVTGATAGFGECITRRFVANGHKVIATGRRSGASAGAERRVG
ncbi:3-hydroxypropionate dehydrogenase [Enterobacter cloacae]|uniref:3-hydroxypropionate dehydrogenase n=1 Tax=Enterobacter cloacae TaxID=550 RepID=A0A377M340_ENTCL|nr:3-hydroxypropionate dehydrogenase [Enterobacter cloacae]